MLAITLKDKKWKKAELYACYWAGYLLLFTLIEGITDHDFFNVFRNELVSLPLKALFVILVVEKLFTGVFERKKLLRIIAIYILLITAFAFLMRLVDNYVILRYFLTYWKKEPLLSAAPFLYNVIKLQFLLTIPFCVNLYQHTITEIKRAAATSRYIEPQKNMLQIKCERRMVNLAFDDIYYFESQGNYLEVFTINGSYKTYLSIAELQAMLPATKFVRVHRSFVVALNKIGSHNHSRVSIGHKNIPIGRSFIPGLKNILSA